MYTVIAGYKQLRDPNIDNPGGLYTLSEFRELNGITTYGNHLYVLDGPQILKIEKSSGEMSSMFGSIHKSTGSNFIDNSTGNKSTFGERLPDNDKEVLGPGITTDGTYLYVMGHDSGKIHVIDIVSGKLSSKRIEYTAKPSFNTGIATDGRNLYLKARSSGAVVKLEGI